MCWWSNNNSSTNINNDNDDDDDIISMDHLCLMAAKKFNLLKCVCVCTMHCVCAVYCVNMKTHLSYTYII